MRGEERRPRVDEETEAKLYKKIALGQFSSAFRELFRGGGSFSSFRDYVRESLSYARDRGVSVPTIRLPGEALRGTWNGLKDRIRG